jgi:hypothetical protein
MAGKTQPKPPLPGAQGPSTTSGSLTAQWDGTGTAPAGSQVTLLAGDEGTVSLQITGTFSLTTIFEGTVDNATWRTIHANNIVADTLVTGATATGIFLFPAGLTGVRIRCSAYTSGTAAVTMRATPASSAMLSVSTVGGAGGGGGGAVTVADGADVAEGTTTDAGVITDTSGTLIGFARGNILQWITNFTRLGSLTEAAPATDTASSGLNGRLQRIAQRITSLIGTVLQVQGPAAAGAVVAGNPVMVGGRDAAGNAQYIGGNNAGVYVQGGVASGGAASGENPVLIAGQSGGGTIAMPHCTTAVDTQTAVVGLIVNSLQSMFNGTSWDRQRNNVEVTLLASASRTTTQTSADITTYNLGAIQVILDMTTVGTGSVTVSIDGKDPASGKYYNLLTGAAVVTNVTNVYTVDPSVPAVANVTAQKRLPRTIRIVVTANNANPASYSCGYIMQPVA